MADALDKAAGQVRIDYPDTPVHRLILSRFDYSKGRTYTTRCNTVLAASKRAILTTHKVTCDECLRPGLVGVAS